MAYAVYIFIGL